MTSRIVEENGIVIRISKEKDGRPIVSLCRRFEQKDDVHVNRLLRRISERYQKSTISPEL